jgi:apolipoprotein N-acyltransferase
VTRQVGVVIRFVFGRYYLVWIMVMLPVILSHFCGFAHFLGKIVCWNKSWLPPSKFLLITVLSSQLVQWYMTTAVKTAPFNNIITNHKKEWHPYIV